MNLVGCVCSICEYPSKNTKGNYCLVAHFYSSTLRQAKRIPPAAEVRHRMRLSAKAMG